MSNTLYDTDFYAWTQEQAALLRAGKLHDVDLANVAEEIESLGKSEWRALGSRLDVLVMHLLKWRYQVGRRSHRWQSTIWTQRRDIQRLLRISSSLRRQVPTMLLEDYASIRQQAATETRMPLATFPEACPWTVAQVLDEDFWPEETP
jgi:hypothetical protein